MWMEKREKKMKRQRHSKGAVQVLLLIGVCVWALATVARIAGAVRDACCRNVL